MAGALLTAAMLASPLAQAGPFQDGAGIPEEMLGVQGRLGASALAGEGAGNVDQPPLTHASLSLQIRVLPDWYLELSTFGERTLKASAPEGKTTLGIESTTAGVRRRAPFGKNGGTRLVLGAGGGVSRVFVQGRGIEGEGGSWSGGVAYVLGGIEKELYGDQFNAGYVGIEGVWNQYFVKETSPFRGGGAAVRVTFSYYMGGSYCSDCL